MLEGFHLEVARIVLRAIEPLGFALGGGYALQAYGIVDRPSADIDSYVARLDEEIFDQAEEAVVGALHEAGLSVTVMLSDSWFRALLVSDEDNSVTVDLGYDYREAPPTMVANIGPVLGLRDVITGKVRALWDRGAARDYIDIDAILRSGIANAAELQSILSTIRPESGTDSLASLLLDEDAATDESFALYGLSADDISSLFQRLSQAADAVHSGSTRKKWGHYQRSGHVHAQRLTVPRTWFSDAGDELRAEVDDWWVIGPDGKERSVKPAEFARTYEHVSEDLYQRIGVLEARPAIPGETVVSLEGPVTAQPGDWVVRDGPANAWPVPGQQFHRTYRQVSE